MALRIAPSVFREALEKTREVIHEGDTNDDGKVEHVELLESPAMRDASAATKKAAELTFLCATAKTREPGATPNQIDAFVDYIGSDRFLETFERNDGSLSDPQMRRALRGSSRTHAGEAAAAVVVLARELLLGKRLLAD